MKVASLALALCAATVVSATEHDDKVVIYDTPVEAFVEAFDGVELDNEELEDEAFVEEGELVGEEYGNVKWRRRRRRRFAAPVGTIHPPTKVQMAAMTLASYGEDCNDDHPEFPGAYGNASMIGNWAPAHYESMLMPSTNARPDDCPFSTSYNLLKVDHGCWIPVAADEYNCASWWSQHPGGKYGSIHIGSAGKVFISGALSNKQWWSRSLVHHLGPGRVCTLAVRGSDGDDLSSGAKPGGRGGKYVPDYNADVSTAGAWNVYYTGLDESIDSKKGMFTYFKDQLVGLAATQMQSRHTECIEWYFTGHSLGGTLATMLALHGYAGVDSAGNYKVDRSYTFGALSFLFGRERTKQPNGSVTKATYAQRDHGGFRLVHEQDFAPNLATGKGTNMGKSHPEIFMHSTGAFVVYCKNNNWQSWPSEECARQDSDQWQISKGDSDYHSNYCNHEGSGGSGSMGGKCTMDHHFMGNTYMYLSVNEKCLHTNGYDLQSGCNQAYGAVPQIFCSSRRTPPKIVPGGGYHLHMDHQNNMCPFCCMKPDERNPEVQRAAQGGGGAGGNGPDKCFHCTTHTDSSACDAYNQRHNGYNNGGTDLNDKTDFKQGD